MIRTLLMQYEIVYAPKALHLQEHPAELAQLVERTTLNRVVEGSIPSFGAVDSVRRPTNSLL